MNILRTLFNNTWDSLSDSFSLLWSKLSHILLPATLILLFLGIALWVVNYISDKFGILIKKVKIDGIFDKILAPTLKLTGTKINSHSLIVNSVRWFLIAAVLIAAMDMADLHEVINFFNSAIGYIPNLFVAALIIIAGSMLANLAATVVKLVSKNSFDSTAKVAVNALALLAALCQLVSPLVSSLSHFIEQLSLSRLQSDVLFIGILVIALLASKKVVSKTVENLYNS